MEGLFGVALQKEKPMSRMRSSVTVQAPEKIQEATYLQGEETD